MKRKIIVLFVMIGLVLTGVFIGININKDASFEDEASKTDVVKQKNLLSYYLENENGEYEAASGETWPTEGYKFNATLSKCENGGELGWDSTKGVVTMTGNMSDKCYIYFDIISKISDVCSSGTKLATCIATLADEGGSSNTNIYHHNGTITSDDGTILDAQDNSYRYAGASSEVNNYVCFGSNDATCLDDNKYRIIGVFGGQVKLIKSTKASSTLLGTNGDYYSGDAYYWNYNATSDLSNTWSTSLLNKINLNTNFITNIGSTWANKISETTWKVGGNIFYYFTSQIPVIAYTNEIVNPDPTNSTDEATEYSAKIGLMYISDYGFAASPIAWTTNLNSYNSSSVTSVNWMFMGIDEWTITRNSSKLFSEFYISGNGFVYYSTTLYTSGIIKNKVMFNVRPTFYLTSDVTYVSGDGSENTPIRIN